MEQREALERMSRGGGGGGGTGGPADGAGPDALRVFVQEKECGSASSLYLLLRKAWNSALSRPRLDGALSKHWPGPVLRFGSDPFLFEQRGSLD